MLSLEITWKIEMFPNKCVIQQRNVPGCVEDACGLAPVQMVGLTYDQEFKT